MEKVSYEDLIAALDNPANKKSQEIIKKGEEIASRINPAKNNKYSFPRAKLVGFVNNHIIEEKIKEFIDEKYEEFYGLLMPMDSYWDYLTDRYIVGDYCDFFLVEPELGIEVKRYNYVDQVKIAMQDIQNYKKAENTSEFSKKLKAETGRFVSIHGANIVLFAVLKENKIIYYDVGLNTFQIYDYPWFSVKLYH